MAPADSNDAHEDDNPGVSGAPEPSPAPIPFEAEPQPEAPPPQLVPSVHPSGAEKFGSPLLWGDLLYLLLFYFIAGYLLTLGVAALAAAHSHVSLGEVLQELDGPKASLAVVIQALLSFATLAFLFVVVRGRSGGSFWPAVGWREFPGVPPRGPIAARYAFFGVGLALFVSFFSSFLDNGKTLPIEEYFHNRQTVVLLILLGVLVAPLVEETLFRGCLFPVIAGRFGIPAGVIVTGILFGFAHAPQLRGGWGQIALLMCVGIVLTYIRARAGTVWASYFVHVAYNSTLFAALILSTSGLRHLPAP